MTKYLVILFFSLFFNRNFSQIFTNDILISIDSSNKDLLKKELSNYDCFFIGETHKSGEVENAFNTISNLIIDSKPNIKVFLEAPYNYNDLIDSIYIKRDTNYWNGFKTLTNDTKQQTIYRNLYTRKITSIKYIDNVSLKNITKWEILKFYGDNENEIILKDLSILRKITFIKKRKVKKYIYFKTNFDLHSSEHYKSLGKNFNYVNNVLNGVISSINSAADSSSRYFQSDFREKYVFDIVCKEIERDTIPFISLNGHFHITLKQQKNWVNKANWISLAARTKEKYKNKNICSIYMLNRKSDYSSDQYFPNEKKLILNHTRPDQIYLIKIDDNNSPLLNLADKFTHILIY